MIDFSSTVVELSGDSEKQKEVQDIAKCLRTLYSTPIGSQEGDRELGINPNIFVDKPLPVAKGLYVAEVTEKTASFEPRARVVRVDWLDSDVLHGVVIPKVVYELVYWRMNVDITDDGVIYYTPEEIEKRLGYARRCTAHLEHIIYIVEPHERSPAYIAAAPCGMATSCTVKVPGRIKPREIGAKAYVAGAVGRSKMQVAVALPGAVEAKAVKARAFTAGTVERSHTAINIVIGGQTT